MPFSSESGKALIDRAMLRLTKQYGDIFFRSNRVLDIGVGSGTYSKRYRKSLPSCQWTGVEIWAPYVTKYSLETFYDNVVISGGLEFLTERFVPDQTFDLCFMGDVVEHVAKEDAIKMVEAACQKCRLVVISIPITHYPQGEYDGNPHEAHVKDDWSHEEVMSSLPHVAWSGTESEIGVYFCSLEPKLVQQILAPLIAVYGICKNEINFIDRFYSSIRDADLITICDTGSTDGTWGKLCGYVQERVHEYGHEEEFFSDLTGATDGAMTVKRVHVSPWRFDDARNVALSLVPEEVDMCISIDVDELLPSNWKSLLEWEILDDLQRYGRVGDRYNHRFETIWDWSTSGKNISSHWHERVHARRGFQWKLPVHEILVKSSGQEERVKWLGGWCMTQKPDTSKPRGSYLPLLEISVKENPNIWKSWSFYGSELHGLGRFDDALRAFTSGCHAPNADVPFLTMQMARVYQSRGELEAAVDHMEQAFRKSPRSRELAVYVADLLLLADREAEARRWLLKAVSLTERSTGYSYDASCWDEAFDARVRSMTNAERDE